MSRPEPASLVEKNILLRFLLPMAMESEPSPGAVQNRYLNWSFQMQKPEHLKQKEFSACLL
jgi:hypothetical protein